MADQVEPVPEDWDLALAIVAHPDDMEYGAASAVARWTGQGKAVSYLLVTRGEAGIVSLEPSVAAGVREREQRASCAMVGVEDVEFLDHPDGLVEGGTALRRDLAAAIRRRRPDVLLSINHHDTWGGPSWNHVDHRVVGRAVLDAARDAGNPWIFPDAGEAWNGVRFVALSSSPQADHGVDIGEHLDVGIASLRCHETYLANLAGNTTDPTAFLAESAHRDGPRLGVDAATTFELVFV
ncbi:MAG: PIG-L family deacetylase [Acidimicrobiia bacterium]|nr:PIG-L family deacetylase [Acidimicrobiia bacterium]